MPLKVDSLITNSVIVNGEPFGLSYKVYTAILTYIEKEVKFDVNILQNTLGGEIVWEGTKGNYTGTLTNAFTENKVYLSIQTSNDYSFIVYSSSVLTLRCDSLNNTPIEIRVYS